MDKKAPVSQRQADYFNNILPKLDVRIADMNLGMRANTCLVNAGICTLEELKKAVIENRHIPLLGRESLEEIKENIKERE